MKKNNMDKLEKIIMKLRSDDGCPWDKELTLEKLGQLTVEEAYELLDAVEKKDTLKIICIKYYHSKELLSLCYILKFLKCSKCHQYTVQK